MASPPVCKILDYSKWVYEQRQRDKESRKKSQAIVIKEMKYRPKIGGGDFDTKTARLASSSAKDTRSRSRSCFVVVKWPIRSWE